MKQMKKTLTGLFSGLLGGVIGAAGLDLAMKIHFVNEAIGTLRWWHLLLVVPVLLLVIFVHEAGHLLGGILKGMRFLLLVVGPFQWTRSQAGLSFAWNFNPATFGGLAAATPDRQRDLLPQLRWLVAGGPLTSLLLGVVTLILAGWLPPHPGTILTMTGLLSLGIFLVTAIPYRAGGLQSDGWQLIELLRGGEGVIERQLILGIMGASLAGQRPRDWDAETVGRLANLESHEPLRSIAARSQAFYHFWDRREMAQVEPLAAWLDSHLEQFPDGFRQAIHLDLALLAYEAGRLADLDRHAARTKGGVVDPSRRQLLAATLALRDGRGEDCRQAIVAARRLLPRGMDPGLNHMTSDQLDQLEVALAAASRG
jgi:hypothetical protein